MKKIILFFLAALLLTSCSQTASPAASSSDTVTPEAVSAENIKETDTKPASNTGTDTDEKTESSEKVKPEPPQKAEEGPAVPVVEEAEPEPEMESAAEEISDLNGLWLQKGYEDKDTYMIALIEADYLQIMWFMDNGETIMMYWEGTFEAPVSPGNYTWESKNTLEGFHLMSSDAESKVFSYTDGDIVYDVTMLGETATVHMIPSPEEMYMPIADVMMNYGNSEESAVPEEVIVTETVLLDESGVKITATGLDTNAFMGPELTILIENNTEQNLTVQTRSASVNGYMTDTSISEDIAPGKKANSEISFSSSDLEQCGIETIADMEFSFHIFDSETWDTYLDTALISVITSAADGYTYTYDDSGEVLYDADGIKITARGLTETFLGTDALIYIHNSTDKNITVQARDTSVNGFMLSPSLSEEVTPGKHSIAGMTFFSSELEENSISKITEIETSFHIFDTDTWETIIDTEPITINY